MTAGLPVEPAGPGLWRLTADVEYELGAGLGLVVAVPAGFVCDLATVPRWARWVVDREAIAPAAVLHDYLLALQAQADPDHAVTRAVADAALYDALQYTDVGPIQRTLVYAAVRAYQALRGAWAPRQTTPWT